jgi:3-methyladenine DNA glycosylase Tag
MTSFKDLRKRAEKRKGGADILTTLLPEAPSQKFLRKLGSNVFLSHMTRGVFQAGFVWRVIEKKWPDFEGVFMGFDCEKIVELPDEYWDACTENARIVRNIPKIQTIRENAMFILDTEQQEGKSFAEFIDDWPSDDLIGLWKFLKDGGSRLGGMTGPYFLRRMGKDSFLLSRDVVTSLQELGLDIKDNPRSKRDFTQVQAAMNDINESSGLSFLHISKILGYASGQNYPVEVIETEKKGLRIL